MSRPSLGFSTAPVTGNGVDDLITALEQLSSVDADFSGANGTEYLWENAEKAGFESNMELVSGFIREKYNLKSEGRILNTEEAKALVSDYMQIAFGNDCYYRESEVKAVINPESGKIVALAWAYTAC